MKKLSEIRPFNKMFKINDNYDDLLEMPVADNRYRVWMFRILFGGFIAALVLFLFN
jgi:hypothetical protein